MFEGGQELSKYHQTVRDFVAIVNRLVKKEESLNNIYIIYKYT